ncbi:AT-hook motif nuclear-localized protein 5-like protein [Tanacetum coccineum]
MDGREGIPSFYLNRGFRGGSGGPGPNVGPGAGANAGSGNQGGGFHVPPPGFKNQSNPDMSPHGHSNMRLSSPMGPSFHLEHNPQPPPPSNFPLHGFLHGCGEKRVEVGRHDDGVVSGVEVVVRFPFLPPGSGRFAEKGRFEILCLSGSYLLAETGNPRSRTGGLSVSVCSSDGQVIGGAVGGKLIASTLVQVVVSSFVYGGADNTKAKDTIEPPPSGDEKSTGVQLN